MTQKFIPLAESAQNWQRDADFASEYAGLEGEFALAEAFIHARSHANMTQEQVAQAMGTTQAVIARLEGGKSMPSVRTLQRFAQATQSRLQIRFESTLPHGKP
ncbi:MAG: helix-turn-helix transcriptional regulator [Alphaproteobacteria bacterium]|nr:helix-turn-helix transcriptional regulator [Alphaproteobacteria bacterium]